MQNTSVNCEIHVADFTELNAQVSAANTHPRSSDVRQPQTEHRERHDRVRSSAQEQGDNVQLQGDGVHNGNGLPESGDNEAKNPKQPVRERLQGNYEAEVGFNARQVR